MSLSLSSAAALRDALLLAGWRSRPLAQFPTIMVAERLAERITALT